MPPNTAKTLKKFLKLSLKHKILKLKQKYNELFFKKLT